MASSPNSVVDNFGFHSYLCGLQLELESYFDHLRARRVGSRAARSKMPKSKLGLHRDLACISPSSPETAVSSDYQTVSLDAPDAKQQAGALASLPVLPSRGRAQIASGPTRNLCVLLSK